MKTIASAIPEVIIVEPKVHSDQRGFFLESYNHLNYQQNGIKADFVQDNHSYSVKGTLRGLHIQTGSHSQAKLVRVVKGEVFDVAVDARAGSPTFSKWVGVRLSQDNYRQLFIPQGFLHGFCVLSEYADFEYKCDNYYNRDSELTIAYDDPNIGIEWPIENPLVSDKDKAGLKLSEVMDRLTEYKGKEQ